jgi:hypothetical protein
MAYDKQQEYGLDSLFPDSWAVTRWGTTPRYVLAHKEARKYIYDAVHSRRFLLLSREVVDLYNSNCMEFEPRITYEHQALYKPLKEEQSGKSDQHTEQQPKTKPSSKTRESKGIELFPTHIELCGGQRRVGTVTSCERSVLTN